MALKELTEFKDVIEYCSNLYKFNLTFATNFFEEYILKNRELEQGRIPDFTFVFVLNGNIFEKRIHSFLLNSNFFNILFEGNFKKCDRITINISHYDTILAFIEFLYKGIISSYNNLVFQELINIADEFLIENLEDYCDMQIIINEDLI